MSPQAQKREEHWSLKEHAMNSLIIFEIL